MSITDWILLAGLIGGTSAGLLVGRYIERRQWDWTKFPTTTTHPPNEYKGLDGMLQEWLEDIIRDPKFTKDVLLDHIIHHAEEGKTEGVSESWQASMTNLLWLVCVRCGILYEARVQKRLERLYEHWQKDPQGMTAPPQMKGFAKVAQMERARQTPEPKRYVRAEPS